MKVTCVAILSISVPAFLVAQQSTPPSNSQPNVFFGDKPNKKDKGTTRPVHGVVKDTAGNYIAQAIVELKHVKSGKKVETVTHPDGSYRFDDLKIADDYELQARHDKVLSAVKKLSIYDARKDPVLNFELGSTSGAIAGASAGEWKPLFNGKDETGWQHVGPGRFTIEDGMLKTEGGMGLLEYTGEKFGNTTIRVVFKTTTPTDNSGVYIRLPEPPPDPWYGVHNGYEVQIDAAGDDWHCTGALYSLSKVTKRTQKPLGEWNTMDIGYIGLQNHDGRSTIYFKEVSIKQ